tara:strand:+ start:2547 stop:3044 length:498 start_codon:yes stop_codon:yes gene_type:complete
VGNYYSGKDGKLLLSKTDGTGSPAFSQKEIGQVQSWSFSQSMSVLEATSMGDTDRILKAGIRSYSGSCRLFYYTSSGTGAPNVAELLKESIKVGNGGGDATNEESGELKLRLRLNQGTTDTNARDIVFSIFITGVSMSSSVGEISSVDFNWEANGAPQELTNFVD